MMKVLIASSIHPMAIDRLTAAHDVICAFDASEDRLQSLIGDRDVLILRSGVQITASVLAAAPHLKLILRAGSGVDNIDLEYVRGTNIQLVLRFRVCCSNCKHQSLLVLIRNLQK